MTRRSFLTGSLVLAAWLITMGFLLKNHYLNRDAAPVYDGDSFFGSVEVAARWRDIEEYMLIVNTDAASGERTIIGAASTIIKIIDEGTTASYRADFRLEGKLSPLVPTATVKVAALLDSAINLMEFHGEAALGGISLSATGKTTDSLLYVKTAKGSNISRYKYAVEDSISMVEAVRPAFYRRMEIRPGSRLTRPIIDPLTGRRRGVMTIEIEDRETIAVGGRDVEAFRVVSSIGDIETTMWIDQSGNTLKRELIGSLSMERTTRERALEVAGSLNDEVEIPELDFGKFAGVPMAGENEEANASRSERGVLNMLLR